jgi:hypothetical protein
MRERFIGPSLSDRRHVKELNIDIPGVHVSNPRELGVLGSCRAGRSILPGLNKALSSGFKGTDASGRDKVAREENRGAVWKATSPSLA